MPVDPVALVRRYHAALNCYRADDIAALFARDASYHSPGVGGLEGRNGIETVTFDDAGLIVRVMVVDR